MTDLVVVAEQALLGAVRLDPARQRHLADLVAPGEFGRPWHGQVLAAMRQLAGRGAIPGLAEVHAGMTADSDLPRQVSHHGVLLADLANAAPRPSHAYARIVTRVAIRRQAGREIALAAADLALPVDLMLRSAGTQLARLELEPGPQRHPAGARNAAQLKLPVNSVRSSAVDRHHEHEREAAQ